MKTIESNLNKSSEFILPRLVNLAKKEVSVSNSDQKCTSPRIIELMNKINQLEQVKFLQKS